MGGAILKLKPLNQLNPLNQRNQIPNLYAQKSLTKLKAMIQTLELLLLKRLSLKSQVVLQISLQRLKSLKFLHQKHPKKSKNVFVSSDEASGSDVDFGGEATSEPVVARELPGRSRKAVANYNFYDESSSGSDFE